MNGSLHLQDGELIGARLVHHEANTVVGHTYEAHALVHVQLGVGWSLALTVEQAGALRDALTAALDGEW